MNPCSVRSGPIKIPAILDLSPSLTARKQASTLTLRKKASQARTSSWPNPREQRHGWQECRWLETARLILNGDALCLVMRRSGPTMTRGSEGDAAISTSGAVLSGNAASYSFPSSPSHVWFLFLRCDPMVLQFWSVSSSILRQESRIFLLGVLRSWYLGSSILVLKAWVVRVRGSCHVSATYAHCVCPVARGSAVTATRLALICSHVYCNTVDLFAWNRVQITWITDCCCLPT
jgi:hypothetical protein